MYRDDIGSADTGARYFARDGKVYAKRLDGAVAEAATALSADGRELDRHQAALYNAQAQRDAKGATA